MLKSLEKILVSIFYLCSLLFSDEALGSTPVLELVPSQNFEHLNEYILFSKTYTGDIDHGTLKTAVKNFERITTPSIQFGFSDEMVHIILEVKNTGNHTGNWILTTGRRSLSEFELYEIKKHQTLKLLDGADVNMTKKHISKYGSLAHEISISANEEALYLLKYRPGLSLIHI